MIRRSLLIAPIAAACLLLSQGLHASPINTHASINAMFARSKTVKFQLRNGSSSPMDLKVGETVMTVKAGETVKLDLAAGTRILTNSTSSTHPAGTLVLEVSTSFSGSTVTLR